jgi:hypothetical protein
MCIEKTLRGRKIDPEKVLAAARALRRRTTGYLFTEKEITKVKSSGRP